MWSGHLIHASYEYHAEVPEEYLLLKPLGGSGRSPTDTRIDLPAKPLPRCRLQVAGRCLLALDEAVYPPDAYPGISGSITLAAVATRDGRVERIQVREARSVPPGQTDALVRYTRSHLSTWQLEPSTRDESFTLAYVFAIDRSLPQPGMVTVDYRLPEGITITARPR
jgi:hypothetical protein